MKKGTKIFLIIVFTILGVLIALLGISLFGLPPLNVLENYEPSLSSKVYSADNTLFAEFGPERRTLVSIQNIPQHLKDAVIAIEDERFFQHRGLDFRGITRAILKNLLNVGFKEGASTITQQLARSLFLTREKTLIRKMREALLSLEIERRYTKEQILEMYLNQVYWGAGTYGIASASYSYFRKQPRDLNLAESALLAGLLQAPEAYSPYRQLDKALTRQKIVLRKIRECGFITAKEEKTASSASLYFHSPKNKDVKAAYFIEFLRIQLEEKYGSNALYKGGMEIYTTLDLNMQRAAEEVFLENIGRLRKELKKNDLNGALIALDPRTGEIKALIGGYNFQESQFNRVTQSSRQPGSAFKPFVYLAAMDRGFKPDDTIIDTEVIYYTKTTGKWAPRNYDGKFRGEVSLRDALANSINVATIRLLEEIGPENVIPYARAAGINSFLGADLSLALGTYVVTPIELTRAFATIANNGIKTEPFAIRMIKDHDGRILEETSPKQERTLNPQSCQLVTELMKGVIEYGTGRWAREYGFTYPASGKTGTTDDYTDAWFVGFMPELVATVYVGCDERKSLGQRMSGSAVALPIWATFMKKAYPFAMSNKSPFPADTITPETESGLKP
ncbi:hypothetical protein AUJ66_06010 [Candidatus Desantisbacteria bacterium CG1_02_38_46]|uniref:peptidoglycan glycosyltransferase n=3 Tax=unclassified Candidatus Desantisiibacteriota TaxID=3106372 RepID=A0A2H9P9S9_9BACT|nr:MAG: hypothetical protein AUJ66_06010 [Candidatus Desantisbacteria bacterium CG1_02_38_46]PIU52259.1 MAG: hypothetical protein COS91_00110 [Candidatus Desantisbacteria bacterium CG07_land_8_20_14_0_80_39_15]PIZ15059.1 MAG: hypothetical protein COY51_06495 [Candidatus Desantisbacteria bacterium CG_4_10_14_0_8_um_filter_39_17]